MNHCKKFNKPLRIHNKSGYCKEHHALSPMAKDRQKKYMEGEEAKKAHKKACAKRYKRVQQEMGEKLAQIKLASGCVDCGYREYACALDFDHLPQFKKSFTIGQSKVRSWKALEAEIAKCEIVCSNCHRVRTLLRREKKC